MPLSTNGTVVARFAGALYNQQLSNATYSEVVTWSNTNNLGTLMNEVYARDFSTVSDNTVAGIIVTNLGLGAIAGTQAFVAAQLTAAGANKGAVLAGLLNGFSQMTADPVYGAAATAYNTQVASSQLLSQTTGNTGGNFVAATTGQTFSLTTGFDNIVGTAFNDIFNAPDSLSTNRLQDGDRLDGGAGVDTLYADFLSGAANGSNVITPNLRNIESVVIRAQNATTDANGIVAIVGINMQAARTVQIDAQRSLATDAANKVIADLGVVNWESSNSRSDVVIEDVRIGNTQKTKDVTITFRESDPGNVDFGVYFDVHSLRNAGTGTASLNIFLMDTAAAAAAATAATPLLNQNFNTYTFFSNNVKVVLGGTGTAAGTAIDNAQTYAQLKDAFILALKTASVGGVTTDLSASVTVTSSGPVNMSTEAAKATESATVSASFLNLTGEIITLTSTGSASITSKNTATNEVGGWTAAGPAPATGAIVQTLNTGSTSTTELVTSKVVLDDVGRGSTGGDLVIGGMSVGDTSTSRGVERFEITVEDSSKLQTINSTNNALREVTIVNGTTSNASSAYNTVVTNAGNLTVNGNVSDAQADADLPGVNNNTTWGAGITSVATANHSGAGAAGFTDVRLIDASAMTGKLAFTAAITTDTLGKYVNLVDTQGVPTADVAAAGNVNFNVKGANFAYTGGANDDTMRVTIDSAVAASNTLTGQSDFTIVIDGGAGNDVITTNFGGNQTASWLNDQARNANVTVNGGAGNDTITTTGAGSVKINAGAGNDTVYTDNSGAKATWVVNAANTLLADLSANAGFASAAIPAHFAAGGSNFLFGGKLTVAVSGAAVGGGVTAGASVSTIGAFTNGFEVTVDIPTDANYKTSQFFLNQAVKAAINDNAVLSKLFVAKDGPNSTLTISSLIDGTFAATDLSMTVSNTALTATDTAALTAYQTVIGNTAAVLADANAGATATVTAANAGVGFSAAGTGLGSVFGTSAQPATFEVATVTVVDNIVAAETQTINGMTFTSTGVLGTIANLELAMETGVSNAGITVTGAYNAGWTVGVGTVGTVTFTSTVAGAVADLVVGGTDGTPSGLAIVQGAAGAIANATGSVSPAISISDNTINMGADKDVLVLSTTVGATAALSSNDKIVFTGTGINTTIVNFDVGGFGIDVLDFTSYLADKQILNAPNTTTSRIPTTLNADATVEANSVTVLAPVFTVTDTFAGLTSAKLLAAINTTGNVPYAAGAIVDGTLNALNAQTPAQLVGGTGHGIVMIENNLNRGEYAVFDLAFNGAQVGPATEFTSATLIGTIDFGATVALAGANLS